MEPKKPKIDGSALTDELDDAVTHVFQSYESSGDDGSVLIYIRKLSEGTPDDNITAILKRFANQDGVADCEIRFRNHDSEGESAWFKSRKAARCTDKSHIITADFENITTKKALENLRRNQALQAALEAAHKDSATGVYNKYFTEDIIRDKLSECEGEVCLLVILDVDLLKNINDTYGHPIGDLALKKIAGIMSFCLRKGDILGRIGGDEFMALLCGVKDEETARGLVEQLLSRISETKICGFNLSVSIGCILTEAGTEDFDTLYRKADKALYHVKKKNKNHYVFYSPNIDL